MFFRARLVCSTVASMLGVDLSTLIAAMMASGGPNRIDARDHRHLHEALLRIGQDLPSSGFLPPLKGLPDPEVGRRVPGVTRALWNMNAIGALTVSESHQAAEYRAEFRRIKELSAAVEDLPEFVRTVIYRRAADWSISVATDLKNDRQPV
jgi:hypothetical protein